MLGRTKRFDHQCRSSEITQPKLCIKARSKPFRDRHLLHFIPKGGLLDWRSLSSWGDPKLLTRRTARSLHTKLPTQCARTQGVWTTGAPTPAFRLILVTLFSLVFVPGASWSGQEAPPNQLTLPQAGESQAQLGKMLKGENGKKVQDCSRKCMPACLRGGEGAPGLGPMTVRKELLVFKEGFRDRKYCLTECTTVCALSYNRSSTQ